MNLTNKQRKKIRKAILDHAQGQLNYRSTIVCPICMLGIFKYFIALDRKMTARCSEPGCVGS